MDPHTALLEEVHRTAGHVAWLGALVGDLSTGGLSQVDAATGRERPAVWVELYQSERRHLTAVAKAALDAGVAERQVRIAEAMGEQLVGVLRAVLAATMAELRARGADPAVIDAFERDAAPEIVRRELLALAAGPVPP